MDRTSCPRGWPAESGRLPNLESFVLRHAEKDDAVLKGGVDLVQAFREVGITLEALPPSGMVSFPSQSR